MIAVNSNEKKHVLEYISKTEYSEYKDSLFERLSNFVGKGGLNFNSKRLCFSIF